MVGSWPSRSLRQAAAWLYAAWALLRDTVFEWQADNTLRLGAALAYYAVFSLAPLLIVALAIVGLVFESDVARARIVTQIGALIGQQGAEATAGMIQRATTPASGIVAAVISIGIILVGASGAFGELQAGLNEMWRVPATQFSLRRLLGKRFRSFLMVLGVGCLFLFALLLNGAVAAIDRWVAQGFPTLHAFLEPAHFLVSFALGTTVFALIFKFLPDVRITWPDVWISAALTAILFFLGQWLIAFYLRHSAVTSAFGAAGSLVVILVWVYYSSQILLFGAEFAKVYTKRHGSHATEPAGPPLPAPEDPPRPES